MFQPKFHWDDTPLSHREQLPQILSLQYVYKVRNQRKQDSYIALEWCACLDVSKALNTLYYPKHELPLGFHSLK